MPPTVIALGKPCERAVLTRYRDACARGLAHAAVLAEAAGLLWALRPALPAGITRQIAEEIAVRDQPAPASRGA